jgi:cation diffusion facilitator family transporter
VTDRRKLIRYAWLSIAAALATIGLKSAAYFLTGSVGLLSDALESGVNLAAAALALIVLLVAALPPDEEHAYGHDKAEYFSGGAEGALIIIAALTIAYTAISRLFAPEPLEQLGVGLVVSLVASGVNLVTALILLRAGQANRSITLEANARHLMSDVWTSVGVVVSLAAVALTRWQPLDSIIALAVAIQIVFSGIRLVRHSVLGLMDTALPAAELDEIRRIMDEHSANGVTFHALRSRQSGARRFMSVHVQVPGHWSVQEGHSLLEIIERDVRRAVPTITVFTHLEPVEDPISWRDVQLSRDDD